MTRAALAIACASVSACVSLSAPTYQGPKSDHFDGERFYDHKPALDVGGDAYLKWVTTERRGRWPDAIDAHAGSAPEKRVDGARMRVTWVGHATVLLQMEGVNILTDPIWSERASPFSFAGPKRVRPPGIRFEDLPHVDVVLVSHNHYDHMDLATLTMLYERDHPLVITGLGNDLLLREHGIAARAVDWGADVAVGDVIVHAVENQHFSGRGLSDMEGTLWSAFVVEGRHAGRAYFAGDTGYGAHFAKVAQRFGDVRLAILPIGAYRPRWFMRGVHVDPAEAVQAAIDLHAKIAVPMHYGTFPMADDGIDEPVRDLYTALDAHPDVEFAVLHPGDPFDVP